MRLNNISLPYPVLGISDDITPLLTDECIKVGVRKDNVNFSFDIALSYNNHDIRTLIENGKAEFSCEYECRKTMLRRCFKSLTPQFTIIVPRKELYGRITFSCFISVKEPIPGYTNRGFHDDYKGRTFNMEQGDILAAFPQCHYDLDIRYDKLQATGTYMQIMRNDARKNVFFDISGDKIFIELPKKLYDLYNNSSVKGAAEVLHASLALNALTYALLNINEMDDELIWVKSIKYRLQNEEGFSLSDLDNTTEIPVLAQRLLKDPYSRLFNKLSTMSENVEDD